MKTPVRRQELSRLERYTEEPNRFGAYRIALGFPNSYEIGMSNLGFQWVYRLFNRIPDVVCERFFHEEGEPAVTFESGIPLSDFGLVAWSLAMYLLLGISAGRIRFEERDITGLSAWRRVQRGIAYTFQITSVFAEFTALQNVALAVQAHAGHSFRFWRPVHDDAALTAPAREFLAQVGLQSRAHVAAANLSHGEHRQLEVAMALATRPRLLLLDEPMAGMGIDESQRMIELLATLKRRQTMILVEHDMDAVFKLADRIAVLVYGRIIATGLPEEIRANAEVRRAYLGEEA